MMSENDSVEEVTFWKLKRVLIANVNTTLYNPEIRP
jgi:hypothetical protein